MSKIYFMVVYFWQLLEYNNEPRPARLARDTELNRCGILSESGGGYDALLLHLIP